MIINDYVWLYLIMYDYIWLYLIMYDYAWLYLIIYDYVWLYMIMYDYIWLYLIIYDYIWLYMIIKWLCMIMYDYIWLYMIIYDMIIQLFIYMYMHICARVKTWCMFYGSSIHNGHPNIIGLAANLNPISSWIDDRPPILVYHGIQSKFHYIQLVAHSMISPLMAHLPINQKNKCLIDLSENRVPGTPIFGG